MIFKDLKALKKALEERGHSMLLIDETLMCESCDKWAKMRQPNDHAYGDAVGANCNNSAIQPQQTPPKISSRKARTK